MSGWDSEAIWNIIGKECIHTPFDSKTYLLINMGCTISGWDAKDVKSIGGKNIHNNPMSPSACQ